MTVSDVTNESVIFQTKTGFYFIKFAITADGIGDCEVKIGGKSINVGRIGKLSTTVYLLIFLPDGKHILQINTERISPVVLKSFEILPWDASNIISVTIEAKAEDGDRRPWFNFVLHNFPVDTLTADVSYTRRKRDSDDIQIKINEKPIESDRNTIKFKFWKYVGSRLPGFKTIRAKDLFETKLIAGENLVEFVADRMPTLHSVAFDFGVTPILPRIPTVDNPKWTGNFNDDTDEILLARFILGEAEGEPREAKIWVGESVLNRVKFPAWPNTIRDVILQKGQYDPFRLSDKTYIKIVDPLKDSSATRKQIWNECCEIAHDIISGKIAITTNATHFHGFGITREWFIPHMVPRGKFIKKIGETYFYWSPN